jgi:hypothetical protein
MAEAIISPGVYSNENDQSAVTQGPIVVGAAIVGPTVNGIPYVPTVVTTYSDYVAKFGTNFNNGTSGSTEYFTSLAAKNYFDNGGNTLLVTRITHQGTGSALESFASASAPSKVSSIPGTQASASFTVNASDTGSWSQILLNANTPYGEVSYTIFNYPYVSTGSYSDGTNTLYVGVGTNGVNDVSSTTNWASYVVNAVNNSTGNINSYFSASFAGGKLKFTSLQTGTTGNSWELTSSFGFGFPTYNNFVGGTDGVNSAAFELETLAWGSQMNNSGGTIIDGVLPSGSASNVRWEVSQVSTTLGTFTLTIRSGNDSENHKNVLETWTNLSMDVNQPNYIARVLGNSKPTYTYSAEDGMGYIDYVGDFPNASRYVRISDVPQAQHGTFDNNGIYQASTHSASLPVLGSGSLNGAFDGGIVDTNLPKFLFENITTSATNAQGFTTEDYAPALNLLSNTDEYQFDLLLTPGLFLAGGNPNINIGSNGADPIALCEGRADAIAIVDSVPYGGSITSTKTAANASNSSYGATYWPWCQIFSSAMGKLVWVPASVLMGGVFAFTDQVSAPWFAPAGTTRGGIPNVVKVERKLSLADRNNLYVDNVNPLASLPGQGIVVYGQKTLQQKSTALDRVSVRRLLIALKGYISGVSRTLVFEQNTASTRNRFLSQVNPYLDSVVQKQGLYAYKVVMDDSNNTPSVIDRNQLIGQIYIQPTKTAEFIILDFNILPTGVSFPS